MSITNIDTTDIEKSLCDEMNRYISSLDLPSILLAGPSGCGKSTLCNLVFGKELCKIGSGIPITKGINRVTDKETPVVIFDSEGYETGAALDGKDNGSGQDYLGLMTDFIERQLQIKKPVDVVWYCVSAPSERITDADLKVIRALRKYKIPTAFILTQIDVATEECCEEMKKTVIAELGEAVAGTIFESTTDNKIEVNAGIKELYRWTLERLPESRKESFIISCNNGFDVKFEHCMKCIKLAAVAAGGACVTPVPFSDAAIITPIQIALISKILAVWNLNQLEKLTGTIALNSILPTLGKSIAGNLLKLIPGIGTFLGTVINSTVAASLTYGLGYALNEACRLIHSRILDGSNINLDQIFNHEFTDSIKKYAEEYRNKDLTGTKDQE